MKKLLGFGILLVGLILIVSLIFLSRGLSGHLLRWRVSLDLSSFRLLSFAKDKTSFSKIEKLEAGLGETRIFIDKTEINDHKKYIEDRKFLLTSLFLPTTSPYPEVITNIIECSDEFKPKAQKANNGTVYTLFAGERFNYGICTHDLIKYDSGYGIFDCKEKGVFEVRVFSTDDKKIKKLTQSFKC